MAVERSEPFRKFRVSESICTDLEKLKTREGVGGPLNRFVEDILRRAGAGALSLSEIPEGMTVLGYISKLQSIVLDLVKNQEKRMLEEMWKSVDQKMKGAPAVAVKAHRPARERGRKAA